MVICRIFDEAIYQIILKILVIGMFYKDLKKVIITIHILVWIQKVKFFLITPQYSHYFTKEKFATFQNENNGQAAKS